MVFEITYPEVGQTKFRLMHHPLYAEINNVQRLRAFMADHVFAVWDFMSLTKRLQREVTCVGLPWLPPPDPTLSRFVNEIVLSEESDLGLDGEPKSHLEMYLAAMAEVNADTSAFNGFLAALKSGYPVDQVLNDVCLPDYVRRFVKHTVDLAQEGSAVEVVAAFLFGREDAIPEMFARLLSTWDNATTERVPWFRYYLERHICLDRDEHGPAARRLLMQLIRSDENKAKQAADAACAALEARIQLWDGVLNKVLGIPCLALPEINARADEKCIGV